MGETLSANVFLLIEPILGPRRLLLLLATGRRKQANRTRQELNPCFFFRFSICTPQSVHTHAHGTWTQLFSDSIFFRPKEPEDLHSESSLECTSKFERTEDHRTITRRAPYFFSPSFHIAAVFTEVQFGLESFIHQRGADCDRHELCLPYHGGGTYL